MSDIAAVDVPRRAARRSERREQLVRLRRSPTFLVGAAILGFWTLCAAFGRAVVPHDPYAQDLLAVNQGPSREHLFGTDSLGRDMFSRVIVGARDILIAAPIATLLATVLGTALGLVMGYVGGRLDEVISRFLEAFMALPLVVTALVGVVALGPSIRTIVLVIGVVFTPLIARTVRAAVLVEAPLEYVESARLRGENAVYIMSREILPNVLAPVAVEFSVRLGYAIFAIATMSFLGFGIQPPSPDWGLEIATNYVKVTAGYWWQVLFDAIAIGSLVVGVNLVADSLESTFE